MTPRLIRVCAGHYTADDGRAVLRRYDNDVTGRGIEWVLEVDGSWVATTRTKREAVTAYAGGAA